MEEQNNKEGGSAPQSGAGEGNGGGGKMGKIIGLVVVVVVIALGVYALTRGSKEVNNITPEAASTENEAAATAPSVETTTPPVPGTPAPEATAPVAKTATVAFTDTGYSPQSVTIKKGDSVIFKNDSPAETWPASATHPTHTVYPGSGIEKCGTSEAAGIFDACRGLGNGESWTFQFNNVGKWNYHDHLSPTKFGSVTVAE